MCALYEDLRRIGRQRLVQRAGLVLCVLACSLKESHAQQSVSQSGHLFDANPQLNSSGYNAARPLSPLIGGNLYASGNIGRGLALRSFSPIGSPTAFEATTGSGLLSNFIRDSVSVADASTPWGGLLPQAFFDPSQTAPTGAYLRGFYAGRPDTVSPTPWEETRAPDGTSPFGGGSLYGSPPAPRGTGRPQQPWSGMLNTQLNTELSSTIFGVDVAEAPTPFSPLVPTASPTYLPQAGQGQPATEGAQTGTESDRGPLDLRILPESPIQPLPTPLDIITQESAIQALAENPEEKPLQRNDLAYAWGPSATGQAPLPTGEGLSVPLAANTGPVGADVFADMQLAIQMAVDPDAAQYAEMLRSAPQNSVAGPTETMEMQTRAAAAAEESLTQILETPVTSFAGDSRSLVNEELRQAEAALDLHHYYDAVRHYERAHLLDPSNPLPLIGRGHGLLAAGEYLSAAQSLISGLERFPDLTRFQMDLTALMGGGEIVDIRRSDLMKLLARHEDPELRFLLGYLEVNTGNTRLGLENLDKAAQEAKPGTLIQRYPQMLRRNETPPPDLSPDRTEGAASQPERLPAGGSSAGG